uniref:C-type lectin domain-containing protein n=1 Tax=Panagrolaimus sp. PS1159 TaxID=55785 RepID=A0AC35G5R3_9BILA
MLCITDNKFFFYFVFSTNATCPLGSIPFISDKTRCLYFPKNKTYFLDAELACINLSGHLPSVHNKMENMFLSQEALKIFTESTDSDFWFGANDINSSPKWSWMDNTLFDYENWDKGQPQNITDNDCGAIILQGGKWKAANCYMQKSYVCMVSSLIHSTTVASITTLSFGTTVEMGSTPVEDDCTDTVSDCKGYECTDDKKKPLMCTFCKKTCNLCPNNTTDPCAGVVTVSTLPPTAGSQCIDTATNCGATSYECNNSLYKPIMCKYCKKTCNLCDDPHCSSYFD